MIYLISTTFFSVDNQEDFYNELLLRRNAINEKKNSNGDNNN